MSNLVTPSNNGHRSSSVGGAAPYNLPIHKGIRMWNNHDSGTVEASGSFLLVDSRKS